MLDPRTGEERKKRFVTVSTAERWWIEQSRLYPHRFLQYMTGLEPAQHHLDWLSNIFDFNPENKKYRLQFIAPRESGKTSVILYALVWYIARFPYSSNCLVSVASKQAESRLGMIRDIIEHDQRFKNVFPYIKIDERQRNTVNEFSVYSEATYDPKTGDIRSINYNVWRMMLKRAGSLKDPTMFCTGAGGKGMIGRRISGLMIFDDIVDESHLKESLQSDMYDYIMRTLIPCLQENAKAINIMTRWMINDIAERIENNPEWHSIRIQAISADKDGKEESYWPEYWPVEKLNARRNEIGKTMFSVMYQNDPLALTAAKFEQGKLHQKLPEVMPKLSGIIVSTDLAISLKESADFTVFAAIGWDAQGNIYVLDMRRIKVTPDILVQQLGNFVHQTLSDFGQMNRVLIENVSFQSSIGFALQERFPYIPVEKVKPIGDKGHRTETFARKVNEGQVYFNTSNPVHAQLVTECINFPLYAHDDCVDTISLALQHLSMSISSSKLTFIKSPFLL